MSRRLPLVAVVALVACGKEPTVVPVRNLERPADMSFLCMRQVDVGNGVLRLTGRPMRDCHPHLDRTIVNQPSSETINLGVVPREFGTFGLVTQTARGELGVIDMDAGRLVDLDRSQPGFNMLPVGPFPEVMAASQDGCLVATANRGSCDLTVVDPQRLLAGAFGTTTVPSTDPGAVASRVVPTTPSGRQLHVAPHEVAFLPQAAASLAKYVPPGQTPESPTMCQAAGAFDQASGQRAPWRAVVTFPSCDLVAVLELPSGTIVSSVYVRPTGVVDGGTEPVCPTECTGMAPQPGPDAGLPPAAPDAAPDTLVSLPPDAAVASDAPAIDASVTDASVVAADAAPADGVAAAPADAGTPSDLPAADVGGPRIPGAPGRIGALVIRPEGNRLYVGGSNDVYITAIDIVDGTLRVTPNGGRIPLHDGAGGVRRLRLSLDPFVIFGGKVGKFMGLTEEKQYLYAFAVDDSIRVVDTNPNARTFERECDINIDPQFVPTSDPQNVAGTVPDCYGLFDDPAHPPAPRRAFARGPGLRIPNIANSEQPPPVPQDITFGSQRQPVSGRNSIVGDFGYIVASDGGVYILNVDSLQTGMNPVDNTFRDYNAGPATTTPTPPNVSVTPGRNFSISDTPLPTRVTLANLQGPRIEGIITNDASKEVVWVTFPDPHAANSQSWLMAWEGALASSTRVHGAVLGPSVPSPVTKQPAGPAGSVLDQGQEFCQQGVLPGDVVLLNGCTKDADCATDGTLVCRQALPGTPGLCFPSTLSKDSALLTQCARQLTSRRRYEVVASSPRQLDLDLKLDELPKTSLDLCHDDTDCQRGPAGVAFAGFKCRPVRKGEPNRCVMPCEAANGDPKGDDTKCRAGTVCEPIEGVPFCVEGPRINPECWPAGAAYEVQAGQSFLVSGGLAPRPIVARVEELPGDTRPTSERRCVPDDTRKPLLVNRVPLDAPHCANVPDQEMDVNNTRNTMLGKGTIPAGPPGTWGNPCLFWGVNDDDVCVRRQLVPNGPYVPTPDTPEMMPGCNCTPLPGGGRPAGCHVKALFQNAEVRFVVTNLEQYAGDANISRFDVTGGFRPELVSTRDDILVTMGVRIVTGPIFTPESTNPDFRVHYLYLLDQGRTGSSATSRGQVLRINPRYSTYGLPWFDSNYSPYPFQIQ